MTELMIKMTVWLVVAIALGFFFGWILSKLTYKKRYSEELESLMAVLDDRKEMYVDLEKKFKHEKMLSKKYFKALNEAEERFAKKSSEFTELQLKFEKRIETLKSSDTLEQENNKLKQAMKILEKRDKERVKELEEFESVLLKAEEMIESLQATKSQLAKNLEQKIELLELENHEKSRTITLYQETVSEFEEELRLYKAGKEDVEFVISKDQFTTIEEQLEKYKLEIDALKIEKEELLQIAKEKVEEIIGDGSKELDESSIVKLFRETYKKITKS